MLTEVQRREDYFQSFTDSLLKQLVECCLHNKPDQRPEISDVCVKLKDIKKNSDQHVLSGSNIIDLFNIVNLGKIQADVLRSDLNKAYEEIEKMKVNLADKNQQIEQLKEALMKMRDSSSKSQNEVNSYTKAWINTLIYTLQA